MRYGVPCKGSKNRLAKKIAAFLPDGETLVELFAGGCAVTHACLEIGKYKKFICNDILETPQLFIDAMNGKYDNFNRWVSRNEFQARKNSDIFIRTMFSFGYNQREYVFGRDKELWYYALHMARVDGDTSLLRQWGISGDGSKRDVQDHAKEYFAKYCAATGQTVTLSDEAIFRSYDLERVRTLVNSVCGVREKADAVNAVRGNYDAVEIPKGAVVYADPPYRGTDKYSVAFDSDMFFDWVRQQPFPVFISEYAAPPDFACIWRNRVPVNFAAYKQTPMWKSENIYIYSKWQNKVMKHPLLFGDVNRA